MFKLDLEKSGTRDQIANIHWIIEKTKEFQKKNKIYSALLTMSKTLTVWITTNCGKFFKRWEYQTALPASWEVCMQVKKQQLEPDMEPQIGSNSWKEYINAVYCHPASLTYIQSTSWEMLGWMKYKLESKDCWEKYQLPELCRWHHPYGRKWIGPDKPLDESER